MKLSSVVVQSSTALASRIEDEVVMMDVARQSYSVLNPVGTRIWELLATPRRVSEICEVLSERYEVDAERCEAEVLAFLDALLERKVVETVDAR